MRFNRIIGNNARNFRQLNDGCLKEAVRGIAATADHPFSLGLIECGVVTRQSLLTCDLPPGVFIKLDIEGPILGEIYLIAQREVVEIISQRLAQKTLSDSPDKPEDSVEVLERSQELISHEIKRSLTEATGLQIADGPIDFSEVELNLGESVAAQYLSERDYLVGMGAFSTGDSDDAIFALVWPTSIGEAVSGGSIELLPRLLILQEDEDNPPFQSEHYNLISHRLSDKQYDAVRDVVLDNMDSAAILVDVPEIVGNTIEICQQIKNDPRTCQLPLIATLRLPTRAIVNAVISAGVDEVIALPTSEAIILERLGRLPL